MKDSFCVDPVLHLPDLQQPFEFQLVIKYKYKKGSSNKVVYLLSRPPAQVLNILNVRCAMYESWRPLYADDPFFGPIWTKSSPIRTKPRYHREGMPGALSETANNSGPIQDQRPPKTTS
uniref:Uncharacterized protein n=1 Tax=Picea glauca TaxID=3330 RepID=A0A101LU17_PICGL|nr:hypothetical protein ABT39_MTgene3415 [Picea glauca]